VCASSNCMCVYAREKQNAGLCVCPPEVCVSMSEENVCASYDCVCVCVCLYERQTES